MLAGVGMLGDSPTRFWASPRFWASMPPGGWHRVSEFALVHRVELARVKLVLMGSGGFGSGEIIGRATSTEQPNEFLTTLPVLSEFRCELSLKDVVCTNVALGETSEVLAMISLESVPPGGAAWGDRMAGGALLLLSNDM